MNQVRKVFDQNPFLFTSMIYLMLMDIGTTTIGLKLGGTEINPVGSFFINSYGFLSLLIPKSFNLLFIVYSKPVIDKLSKVESMDKTSIFIHKNFYRLALGLVCVATGLAVIINFTGILFMI